MAIKKVRIRPEGGNNYADVLHPETSADIVIESEDKMFVSSAEKTKWNNKADKTYVDTELNKRYLKEQVFTKEEVLQKIQDIIGTAPEALDTLQEIAEALNNDPDFATSIINLLSTKVDKIEGKQLSTEDYTTAEKNKLAGIEEGANKYIHPSTHPASMITGLHRVATTGIADKLNIVDTRSDNSPPSYYFSRGKSMFWEFKYRTSVGNPPVVASASGTYAFILTITGWNDSSGGYPVQISVGGKNLAIRQGVSTDAWGSWFVIPNMNDLPTKLSQLTKDINFDERYYTETEIDNFLANKVDNSRVLTDVPANAKFTDTTYSEISTSEIDAGTSSTLRTISGRRVKYILDKVSTMISTAISNLTKADIGLGNVDNVKQATKVEFNTHNNDSTRHITSNERNKWNNKAEKSDIPTKVGQLENDKNYVTQEELESATHDSMVKSVYDKNDDGIVDVAETVIGNEIQLGSYKLVYNSTTNSLDVEVVA